MPIRPNQTRGQTTAFYIFLTSSAGMAFGTSLAAFTGFLFQDHGKGHYLLATA